MNSYFVIEEDLQTFCEFDPCETVLKSGSHYLRIQKDGYITEGVNISVKRGRTQELAVTLKKIPTLEPSITVPQEKDENRELPEILQKKSLIAPTWDLPGKQLIFWDAEGEKLRLWDESGIKTVTALKNMEEGLKWYWSYDSSQLVGTLKTEIYFIDIKKASRKKIITSFLPLNMTWSPTGSYLLTNDIKGGLYKIDVADKTVEAIDQILDLKQAVWDDDDTLIYFTYDEEKGEFLIQSLTLSTLETKSIMRKTNFKIEKVLADQDGIVYVYNPAEERWYQLTY
ncbi:PEGA domain-containing protein [Patescibacteria group bacterium]|nr:PEGA domain-containing protein [Patescibacteria group bacterium]